MLTALLLLVHPAVAGSLDAVEVAGPWGSPTATDATAMWWNPGGLAAGSGTRFMVEGAPTIASVRYDRVDPYGYEGRDRLGFFGVVPYAGFATDAGVDGLGLGLGVAIPIARAGNSKDEIPLARDYQGDIPVTRNVGRYSTRTGRIDALHLMGGGGWDFGPVSVGAAGHVVVSTWTARLDSSLLVDLDHQIRELNQDPGYTDAMIEDPRYAATLDFGALRDVTGTFSLGVQAEPVEDLLSVGVTYTHGYATDNTGDLKLHFACPPQDDSLGRFGAEAFGVCDTTINAKGRVQYRLPSRLSLGARFTPTDAVQVEVMGGWVGWGVFQDFDIAITGVVQNNDPNDFNDLERTAGIVQQRKAWARDNHDTFWVGLDGKVEPADGWIVGGRVVFDQAAVPNEALMLNNLDMNQLLFSALGGYDITDVLQVGLTFTHYQAFARTVTDSAFYVTLDEEARAPERYSYPHANGTYAGNIERIGVSLRGHFGGDDRGRGL